MSERASPPHEDALAPFVAAYRVERRGEALDARAVRQRVLAGRARLGRRRARLLSWLLPIAAVLAGSGAFAASAPGRLYIARLFERAELVRAPNAAIAGRPPRSNRSHVGARVVSGSEDAPSVIAATPSVTGAAPRVVEPAPWAPAARPSAAPAVPARHVAPHANTVAPSTVAPSSKEPAATSSVAAFEEPVLAADLALYRVAHRLHFGAADYAGALKAWGAYLARYPNGTLAPEARLNRAVCLAHLGELAEARAALTMLANGRFGEAGRARARRLLDALGAP